MHVMLPNDLLATAINRVQGAVSEKSFGHLGLKAEDGVLKVQAADRVLAVYCELECQSLQTGEVFVPAKFFADVVKELPHGLVSLETQRSWLNVTAGQNKEFSIKIPLKEDLYWLEAPSHQASAVRIELASMKLAYMIEQVQFCVAQESPKNYGTVGYLHKINAEALRLVGTDGFRLSYCDIAFPLPADFLAQGVCISKRALGELLKMCHEGFDSVQLSLSDDQSTLCAQVAGYQIFVLLSAVKYPHYQGVIPAQQPAHVEVARATLQSVAKRVLLAAGKTKTLQMQFAPQSLTLSAKNLGNSEGQERIAIGDYVGPECHLAVNGKFLADIFAATTSDALQIQFKNQEDPIVVIPAQEPKGCLSRHILVPIREHD